MHSEWKASFTVEVSLLSFVLIMLLVSLFTYLFLVYDRLCLAEKADRALLWAASEIDGGREVTESEIKVRIQKEQAFLFMVKGVDYHVQLRENELRIQYPMLFNNFSSIFDLPEKVERNRKIYCLEKQLRQKRGEKQSGSEL
ncbi:hypothetical protein FACS189418_5830 [Clostridia bacterium]|nr:hypothetical protein FACS189418_5830 [Clostridia bacterium]